jgi:peptide/nickel transport system permease protein
MLRYFLRRLLIALPTLLIVSLAVFGISKCAPGDPVETLFSEEIRTTFEPGEEAKRYQRAARQLGLDKPVFYFTLTPAPFPDTFWRIYPPERSERLSKLVFQTGNWPDVLSYDSSLSEFSRAVTSISDTSNTRLNLSLELSALMTASQLEEIEASTQRVSSLLEDLPAGENIRPGLISLQSDVQRMQQNKRPLNIYRPTLHWYGTNNQYHAWITGYLTGNWGLTRRMNPVWDEIKPALLATAALSGIALLLAFLIAIPLGVEMARFRDSRFDRWSKQLLFFLHSMPVFWLGGILVILFTGSIFGRPIIDNPYLDVTDQWLAGTESFTSWFVRKVPGFIMPVAVLTLHALALIAMQIRGGMLETLRQDYIRTARAKGLDEDDVYWKHAFLNALFPIITLFGALLPALLTGSLVVETLFNFPGLGVKTQTAFLNHDLGTLSAILMAVAILTVTGNLVTDMLYALADPRVRF